MRSEAIVCFVDIGGFVDHHCLNIVFVSSNYNFFFSNIMNTMCIFYNKSMPTYLFRNSTAILEEGMLIILLKENTYNSIDRKYIIPTGIVTMYYWS